MWTKDEFWLQLSFSGEWKDSLEVCKVEVQEPAVNNEEAYDYVDLDIEDEYIYIYSFE